MEKKMFYKNMICLAVGIIIGVRLTDLWGYVKLQNLNTKEIIMKNMKMKENKETTTSRPNDSLRVPSENYNNNNMLKNVENVVSVRDSITVADYLFNRTRVLCWIMTTPENHLKRAMHVRNTWGSRCNKLLFMSTEKDRYLNTIKLSVGEGRSFLWEKTRAAFRYVYDNHFDEAEWFLKADDDTYIIMENLRFFLYQYSSDAPVYFGCKFHPFIKQGYMSGGAGYVLSKEALRRFAEVAYANTTLCSKNQLSEDKEMGICLQNVDVIAGDSRDEKGQERFVPLAPKHLIPIDISDWYAKYLFYKRDERFGCCSRQAISFHYIKPKEFYILDYMLYHLRPFGLYDTSLHILPPKANISELLQKWRTDVSNNIYFHTYV